MIRNLIGILLALLLFQPVSSHFKARYHVIVDMDGGADDLRALCMMLASPEIEVMAVTTTNGTLGAGETTARVTALLKQFGHEGIPVGTNNVSLINRSIELEDMPVDIVALGPLTNIAELVRQNPQAIEKIRRLYVFKGLKGPQPEPDPEGTIGLLIKSGLRVDEVGLPRDLELDRKKLLKALSGGITRYSLAIRELYSDPDAGFMEEVSATEAGSDIVPLYMLYPEIFDLKEIIQDSLHREATGRVTMDYTALLAEVLESDREDKSIIFSSFPVDAGLFEEDVASIAPALIDKHGLKEWKIVVITNEFHEHLGIYSILGAKMGLRAREFFHVGIDELEILSFAGSNPPVSCLNDGLQVSTGGTLGHGTIHLDPGMTDPGARFSFKDRIIEVSVKEAVLEQIKKDVRHGIRTYGLDSPEYWQYIRELALTYWLELDRFEIFEIREIES